LVPHAGEHKGDAAGPSSIWSAIEELHAERIGHGHRAYEDETLVEYLRDHQIPLELCPTSNVLLGSYDSLSDHPLKHLLDAGCFVTINTDHPEIFSISLTDEYMRSMNALGCLETISWL
jgi:aminodeoxyfutalosine deaminase